MKNAGMLMIVALAALCLVGCVTQAAVDARVKEKVAKFETDKGRPPTVEERQQLELEARAEVEKDVAEKRAEALARGGAAAGKLASGDIFGALASLVGIVGLFVGGPQKKPEEART